MDPGGDAAYDGDVGETPPRRGDDEAMILLLLRHAKAEPSGAGGDYERALTRRGETDARRLGRYLGENGPVPGKALVSSARRTRQTYEAVAAALGGAAPAADHQDDLFDASAAEVLGCVQRAVDADCLMVVGHNPAVAELAASLAGDGDLAERRRLAGRFPPCSLAVLEFAGEDWRDARIGAGRLQALVLLEDLPEDLPKDSAAG